MVVGSNFSKYCQFAMALYFKKTLWPSNIINTQQKIACYTAAVHNIFKSPSKNSDVQYKEFGLNHLLSTSKKRILKRNKLLMLLSLIDTIECTKRFSKKENAECYLQQKTILKNVCVETSDGKLIIDYSNLYKHIKSRASEELIDAFNRHIYSVKNLNTWTDFVVNEKQDCSFVIGLR